MKLRLEKGTYRYRTAHKKRQLFFVVLFILAIVAQLILRNFITAQIYKNLVTISAILTVLPMLMLLVFIRYLGKDIQVGGLEIIAAPAAQTASMEAAALPEQTAV